MSEWVNICVLYSALSVSFGIERPLLAIVQASFTHESKMLLSD